MAKTQTITSLPLSPHDDRRGRMLRYSIAMSIRLLCIFACFITPGWWLLIPAIGAIVLPYIAVVLANVSASSSGQVQVPDARDMVIHRDDADGAP